MAMTHAAMFDAVNAIERKYKPYLVAACRPRRMPRRRRRRLRPPATVLAASVPQMQAEMKAALAAYLAAMPDGAAKRTASGSARRSPRR